MNTSWSEASMIEMETASLLPRPAVRLARLDKLHTRVAELLRYAEKSPGSTVNTRVVSTFVEFARRGMIDPYEHIVRKNGAVLPTNTAKYYLKCAVAYAEDHGLIVKMGTGLYMITEAGRSTLRDWDDPLSDGLFAR